MPTLTSTAQSPQILSVYTDEIAKREDLLPEVPDSTKERKLIDLEISKLYIPDSRWEVSREGVEQLKISMKAQGQRTPIEILHYYDGNGHQVHELVAGMHRIVARKELGYSTVQAWITHMDSKDVIAAAWAALVEIDENICRRTISAFERVQLTKRRIDALRTLGLLSEKGDNQHTLQKKQVETTHEFAKRTGRSRSTVQKDLRISNNLSAKAAEKIKDTPLAKSTKALLTIADSARDKLAMAREKEALAFKGEAAPKSNKPEIVRINKAESAPTSPDQEYLEEARRLREEAEKAQLETIAVLEASQATELSRRRAAALKGVSPKEFNPKIEIEVKPGEWFQIGQHYLFVGSSKTFRACAPESVDLAILEVRLNAGEPFFDDWVGGTATTVLGMPDGPSTQPFLTGTGMDYHFMYETMLGTRWKTQYQATYVYSNAKQPPHWYSEELHGADTFDHLLAKAMMLYSRERGSVLFPYGKTESPFVLGDQLDRTIYMAAEPADCARILGGLEHLGRSFERVPCPTRKSPKVAVV